MERTRFTVTYTEHQNYFKKYNNKR